MDQREKDYDRVRGREMRGNDALSKGGSEGSEEGKKQGGRKERREQGRGG